jgi:hypothetical protein
LLQIARARVPACVRACCMRGDAPGEKPLDAASAIRPMTSWNRSRRSVSSPPGCSLSSVSQTAGGRAYGNRCNHLSFSGRTPAANEQLRRTPDCCHNRSTTTPCRSSLLSQHAEGGWVHALTSGPAWPIESLGRGGDHLYGEYSVDIDSVTRFSDGCRPFGCWAPWLG